MGYTGKIFNDTSEGLFRSSYIDPQTSQNKWFVATHLRPNMARNVFPSFDEPGYKTPITIKIGRHRNMTATSNMPLDSTEPMYERWIILFLLYYIFRIFVGRIGTDGYGIRLRSLLQWQLILLDSSYLNLVR